MLVEELLQLLVDIVDADLLEAVVVEDLKTGNIEDADIGDLLHGRVTQGLVALVHHNPEIQMQMTEYKIMKRQETAGLFSHLKVRS